MRCSLIFILSKKRPVFVDWPTGVYLLDFFCLAFSCMYCCVVIFVPFFYYLNLYIIGEMKHRYVRDLTCEPTIYVSSTTSEIRVSWYHQACINPPVIFLLTVPRWCFLWILFSICVSRVSLSYYLSVPCILLVTWWDKLISWLS